MEAWPVLEASPVPLARVGPLPFSLVVRSEQEKLKVAAADRCARRRCSKRELPTMLCAMQKLRLPYVPLLSL